MGKCAFIQSVKWINAAHENAVGQCDSVTPVFSYFTS